MESETETKGSGGALLVGLVVLIGLVVVGIIALGPVTSNLAEVQTQKSAAVQAEAASRAQIAAEREATAREEARLRAENAQQTNGYLVILAGCVIAIVAGVVIGGLLVFGQEWVADNRQRRDIAWLAVQQQAALLLAQQQYTLQLPEPRDARAAAVILTAERQEWQAQP